MRYRYLDPKFRVSSEKMECQRQVETIRSEFSEYLDEEYKELANPNLVSHKPELRMD